MGTSCGSTVNNNAKEGIIISFIVFIGDINKNSFDFLYVVGKGGFGKVWKVLSKKNKKFYAMKEMSKALIIDKKSEKNILYERDLLTKLRHP